MMMLKNQFCITGIHYILNDNYIAHHIAMHCGIMYQINAAFVGIKHFFKNIKNP